MKRLFSGLQYTLLGLGVAVLFASLSTAPVHAANPTTIPFQGKVVNSNGTNVTDGTYSVTFKLYTVASGGTALWGETQASVQVTSGIFQVNLGSTCSLFTTQTCGAFNNTAIDFNANPSLYLGVTFNNDPAGEMTPRIQLGSVPYAFNADKVGGLAVSQLVQLSPSSQQTGGINISGNLQAAGSVQLGSTTAAGSIILKDGTSTGNSVTINSVGLAATYVLNLPTTAPTTTGQCLSTSSTTQLSFTNCNSFTTLNQAYANSGSPANILLTDAKDFSITAADTAADPNVLVNLQCTTSCGSNGRFAVQSSGTDVLTVSPNGGAVTFQNSANSISALRILSAGSSSRTILGVNTVSSQISVDGNFVVTTSDPVMTNASVAAASNTGGTLSGSSSSKYFYRVSAITAGGETAASTETSIIGSSFTPTAAPSGYTLTFAAGGAGGITGSYFYTVTYVTANGETTPGPAFSYTSNGKQVNISGIPTGPSGVTSRRLYRTIAGGADGSEKFLTEIADNTTTTYTDATQDASLGSAQPTANNARLNTNTATISWSAYPGATSYRVYRGTAAGAESSYQTTTSSPFTDTGAVGTAGTPTDAITGRVGIGTSTPDYKLDVSGNLNISGTYLANGVFGVSNTCASGTTFSGITVSAGIITSTGSCVGVSGGGGSGGSASLQDAYNTSGTATPQIKLSTTNGGLKVYDAATTVGNILDVRDNTGSNVYFAVTTAGVKGNTFDAASGTVLNLGATASPQATSIVLNQDTTLAANHLLNFANAGNSNLISLTAASGSAAYALTLPSTTPAINQCLQTGAVTAGQLVWGSCSSGGGISIGALDSQTKSSNGAVAVNGVLYLQSADGSNPGLVTAGAQTIGGAKTFNGTLAVGSVLTADVTNNEVQIGSGTTDTTQMNLQLDSYSNFTDSGTCNTTSTQGSMYFNTASNAIRACINGSWEDLVSTAGLGILTFGVVADSGSTNPGDLANKASTTAGSGPCKVAWASTTAVSITDCIAYSGGRKVVVAAQPSVTIPTKNGNWVHICLNGTNGQPLVSAQVTTETAGLPNATSASLVSAPVVCLADIKTSASAITGIYDTRVFTNTQKTFVNTAVAMGLGWIAKDNSTTSASTVTATATANQPYLKGVVVASTGAAWAAGSGPTAIMAYAGPVYVKAASGTLSATSYVSTTTTTGYATITTTSTTNNVVTNIYNSLGIAETAYSATCTTATNCNLSLLVNLDIR